MGSFVAVNRHEKATCYDEIGLYACSKDRHPSQVSIVNTIGRMYANIQRERDSSPRPFISFASPPIFCIAVYNSIP